MTTIKLDAKNRLSIPSELLDRLNFKPGSRMNITIDNDSRLVLTPLQESLTASSALTNSIVRKNLDTTVQFIRGVGPRLAEALARKGIITVEDALYLLPNRYEDRRELKEVARLKSGLSEVFHAEILSAEVVTTKGGRCSFEVIAGDGSATISLKWFNYNANFIKKTWKQGRRGIFTGEVRQYGDKKEIYHPDAEWLAANEELTDIMARDPFNFGRIVPVYPLTEGLNQKTMRKIMKEIVDNFSKGITSTIPESITDRHNLMPLDKALQEVHFPDNKTDLTTLNNGNTTAHHSLVFDELFFLGLGLALRGKGVMLEQGISFSVTHRYTKKLSQILPFQLTSAQRRVLTEIKNDMMAPYPMHRLVQGDVGSGKTLVALMAALVAVENDYQVAIMAPTEILAEQHYLNLHHWCEELGVTVTLITAGLKGKAKITTLEEIARGDKQIIIGTHAIIQDKVKFHHLGLGIVDEQHRFGVLQRGLLKKKGTNPDILVMTATPIPRTLAMTVFGDLSLSVIDELPPGRVPVETKICFESRRAQVYQLISNEAAKGRQTYIIYPLVEESEKSDLKAATQMAEHLQQDIFPNLSIALLHGRMKPEEKEAVMRSFNTRETDILIATTVIEVGIDVPNATVMIIEHAERFGLSQLHQLRGRVGRSNNQSYCILLTTGKLSDDGRKRLKVMEVSNDGFRIAEADLEIRGPGDFLGTRQAGLPDFRVANILRDGRALEEARSEAFALVEQDPTLSLAEHAQLREELIRRWGGRLELAGIA